MLLYMLLFSDRENPKFTSCPASPLYVKNLETINVTPPTVTDNSGVIASLTVNYNMNHPVVANVNITWTATDHQGNEADPACVVEVQVYGMWLTYSN